MHIGRIDVHSHLLPGMDDGCEDESQSLACARALVEAGYTHAFCTPHFWPSLPGNTVPNIRKATEKLQQRFTAENLPLTLMPGGEINLLEAWPDLAKLANEQIPTFAMAGKYALFDFWADTYAECRDDLEEAIGFLRGRGMRPILAHPERISAMREKGSVDRMAELGVLLQLNCYCLAEPENTSIYQAAARLLKEDRYFLIGSDTHRPTGMDRRARGLAVAEKLAGKDTVDRLTIENPRRLIPESVAILK
jgi:protein-tyrosine phosphatase